MADNRFDGESLNDEDSQAFREYQHVHETLNEVLQETPAPSIDDIVCGGKASYALEEAQVPPEKPPKVPAKRGFLPKGCGEKLRIERLRELREAKARERKASTQVDTEVPRTARAPPVKPVSKGPPKVKRPTTARDPPRVQFQEKSPDTFQDKSPETLKPRPSYRSKQKAMLDLGPREEDDKFMDDRVHFSPNKQSREKGTYSSTLYSSISEGNFQSPLESPRLPIRRDSSDSPRANQETPVEPGWGLVEFASKLIQDTQDYQKPAPSKHQPRESRLLPPRGHPRNPHFEGAAMRDAIAPGRQNEARVINFKKKKALQKREEDQAARQVEDQEEYQLKVATVNQQCEALSKCMDKLKREIELYRKAKDQCKSKAEQLQKDKISYQEVFSHELKNQQLKQTEINEAEKKAQRREWERINHKKAQLDEKLAAVAAEKGDSQSNLEKLKKLEAELAEKDKRIKQGDRKLKELSETSKTQIKNLEVELVEKNRVHLQHWETLEKLKGRLRLSTMYQALLNEDLEIQRMMGDRGVRGHPKQPRPLEHIIQKLGLPGPPPTNLSTEVIDRVVEDDKEVVTYSDLRKEIKHGNGITRVVYKDLPLSSVFFDNGDRKDTYSDSQTTVYKYAATGTIQYQRPTKGEDVYWYPEGQVEVHKTTGYKEIYFANGEFKSLPPNRD